MWSWSLVYFRGVAGLRLRVVCEKIFENKVHAAQSLAGRKSPLRRGGGLGGGGAVSPPTGVSGQRPGKFWKSWKFES